MRAPTSRANNDPLGALLRSLIAPIIAMPTDRLGRQAFWPVSDGQVLQLNFMAFRSQRSSRDSFGRVLRFPLLCEFVNDAVDRNAPERFKRLTDKPSVLVVAVALAIITTAIDAR